MPAGLGEWLIHSFLVSLGVTLGGSLLGAVAAVITGGHPLRAMRMLSEEFKLWGVVAALGGTFLPLRNIEAGLFGGHVRLLARQTLIIGAALLGAHAGYLVLRHMAGER
jgi:hypothetical protein